jgi:large subunit ribosomal protein L29
MTGQEARDMTDEKLGAELADLRRRLFSLRTQTVTEKVEDNSQFRKVRRDIARLLTVQKERRTAAAEKK